MYELTVLLLVTGLIFAVFAGLAGVAELLERCGVDGYRLCRRMGLAPALYPERDPHEEELLASMYHLELRPAPYDHEYDGL